MNSGVLYLVHAFQQFGPADGKLIRGYDTVGPWLFDVSSILFF